MNNERLAQLLKFYQEDTEDPFNIYCLANEYKDTDPEKALFYYQQLLNNHAEYLPAYYHTADLYINANKINLAKDVLAKGIELAAIQGDQLALRELNNLMNNLLDY